MGVCNISTQLTDKTETVRDICHYRILKSYSHTQQFLNMPGPVPREAFAGPWVNATAGHPIHRQPPPPHPPVYPTPVIFNEQTAYN